MSAPSPSAPPTSPQPSGPPPTAPGPSNGAAPTMSDGREWVPEAYRENARIARHKDLDSVFKSYLSAEEMIAKRGVTVPGEGASPEQVAAYREAIGVPPAPDKYDLGGWQPPEGLPWNQELVPKMLGKFHELGIPNGAAKAVIEHYAAEQATAYQDMLGQAQHAIAEGFRELKRDYGQAYDSKVSAAQQAFARFAGDRMQEVADLRVNGTPFHEHPAIIRLFAEIGSGMGEHRLIGDPAQRIQRTPTEAKSEIARLHADSAFMKRYTDNQASGHQEAIDQLTALYKAASEGQGA